MTRNGANVIEPRELEALAHLDPQGRVAQLAELSAKVAHGANDTRVLSLIVRLVLQEDDDEVLRAWLGYFGASRAEPFFPFLEAWLDTPDEDRRLNVIVSAAWNRAMRTNDLLLRTIRQDPSLRVRRLALKFLVRRGSLGEWDPRELDTIVRKTDWRPITRREYERLMNRSEKAGPPTRSNETVLEEQVPFHLRSTVALLTAAFPSGISEQDRKPLLRALYDHTSHRNLAEAMSYVTRIPAEILLNEVFAAAELPLDDEEVRAIVRSLEPHGFGRWSQEE